MLAPFVAVCVLSRYFWLPVGYTFALLEACSLMSPLVFLSSSCQPFATGPPIRLCCGRSPSSCAQGFAFGATRVGSAYPPFLWMSSQQLRTGVSRLALPCWICCCCSLVFSCTFSEVCLGLVLGMGEWFVWLRLGVCRLLHRLLPHLRPSSSAELFANSRHTSLHRMACS